MQQHCYKHTHSDGELLVWQLLKKTIYGINQEFSEGNATEINGSVPDQWLPEHILPTTPFPDELLPGLQ